MKETRLNEKHTWRGRWWLPENPDEVHSGFLTYDPNGSLELVLVGGFDATIRRQSGPYSWDVLAGFKDFPVVHGIANGRPMTLLDVYPTSTTSYGFGFVKGPDEQTLQAQLALVGAHVASLEDDRFERADVAIEDLYLWSHSSAMRATVSVDKDKETPTGAATIELSRPEDTAARLPDATITLTHHLVLPTFDAMRGGSRGRVEHQPVLKIMPDQPASTSSLLGYVDAFQDLLAVATGRGPGIIWLTLFEPRHSRNEATEVLTHPNEVTVCLLRRGHGDATAKALESRELVVSLEDVDFATVIPRWWEVRTRFLAVCNMLLSERFVPGGFLEPKLITAVSAAEAFHGALKETPPVSKEQNLERLRPALEALDETERTWLKSFVPGGFSLHARLERLAERIPERCRTRLLPDTAAWIRQTKKARNDLAHSGASRGDPQTLLAVVYVTRAVVLVNILLELGLSEERLYQALTENKELDRACRSAANHFPTTGSGSTAR